MRTRSLILPLAALMLASCASLQDTGQSLRGFVSDTGGKLGSFLNRGDGDAAPASAVQEAKAPASEKKAALSPAEEKLAQGMRLLDDESDDEDIAEGLALIKGSAEEGLAEAQFQYALLHQSGRGVSKDAAEAIAWFEKAASAEHPAAQYQMGLASSLGQGLAQDETAALKWWESAAWLGHSDAQFMTGTAYADGSATERDQTWAIYWIERAAAQGHVGAQFALGVAYTKGMGGLNVDFDKGYKWLAIAAKGNHEPAAKMLGDLEPQISEEALAKLETVARDWAPPRGSASQKRAIVRVTQVYLERLGYEPGPTDGLYGPATRQAIVAFQHDRGLAPTGRISEELAVSLRNTTKSDVLASFSKDKRRKK